jgi:hypothetical protein
MSKLVKNLVLVSVVYIAAATVLPAQSTNAEIFVFSLDNNGQIQMSSGSNISASNGYDNQPTFGFDGKTVLFTSDRGGSGTDIYEYSLETATFTQITKSTESEYTPRAVGTDRISFIREGAGQEMTLWSYDRATKAESKAIEIKEPVAYYDWNSSGSALVWVRYASMAHFVDPKSKKNLFVSDHVLPSTPHSIPGTGKFSFVHRQGNDEIWIKEFDPSNSSIRPLVQTKDSKIDYCWTPDGVILMASGSKLYAFDEKSDKTWRLFADFTGFGLKDITRLDVSRDGTRIAVVSNQ